jgi:flavodoxin
MQVLVIYATKFGNTERVAEAIAKGAGQSGPVRVVSVEAAAAALAERPGLLLIGGPTQRHGMSPELKGFLETLRPGSLEDVPVAAFDTRYKGSTLMWGSAAGAAAKQLEKAGGRLVAPAESFFVDRGGPPERQTLRVGELEHAEAWGRAIATAQSAHAA